MNDVACDPGGGGARLQLGHLSIVEQDQLQQMALWPANSKKIQRPHNQQHCKRGMVESINSSVAHHPGRPGSAVGLDSNPLWLKPEVVRNTARSPPLSPLEMR